MKLYNLLRRAGIKPVSARTLERLNEIVFRCETLQRIRNATTRFKVSIGYEDTRFNAQAYIDITFFDGRSVLHIDDDANRFSESLKDSIVLC